MKCDACGAPIENGKCTYCGKVFGDSESEKTVKPNNIVNVYMQPQIQQKPKIPFWKKAWFVMIICLFMPYIGVFLLWIAKKPSNIIMRIILTMVLISYSMTIIHISNENNQNKNGSKIESESKKPVSVWLDGYTPIDNFEYYIDGNEIYLTDFNSREKKIRINSSYEIEGKTYNVVSLDEVFTLNNVTSAIIPEGVRSVARNEFGSCGIEFLYLPSTLQDIGSDSFWGYFRDVEKIYYGGSEEQWNELCNVDRSAIKAKQIIFDTNPDDLK